MSDTPQDADLDVMLLPADDGMEVTVFDGDQPVLEVGIIDLVAAWAHLESVQGELHPSFDDTLNVLGDMTYAIIKVLEMVGKNDPHRDVLLGIYAEAYAYTQKLVEVLTDD